MAQNLTPLLLSASDFVLCQTDLLLVQLLRDKRKWKGARMCVANVHRKRHKSERMSRKEEGDRDDFSRRSASFSDFPWDAMGRLRRPYPPRSRDIARVDERGADIPATRVSSRSMIYFIALRERPA